MKILDVLQRFVFVMAGAGLGFIIAGLLAGGGRNDDR
jgi:hypothetical protein